MKRVNSLPRSNIRISTTTAIRWGHNDVEQVEEVFISKDSGMISGVYEIRNKFTGERYIGMSRNLRRRFARHTNELLEGIHHCVLLQKAWTEYFKLHLDEIPVPKCLFEFNVIVYCRVSELTYWEHKLIKAIRPEYNTHMENGHSRARLAKESINE